VTTERRLLVVDDDEVFRSRLIRALEARGLEVSGAGDHGEALARAAERRPDLAVVDLRMPGRSGLEVVRDLKTAHPDLRVVVLTGYGSIASALEAVRLGATHYLTKPADADEVLAAFERTDGPAVDPLDPPEQAASLERVEWEHIQRVLTDCGGNISRAARVLGIHRRTLQRKLANYPPVR